MTWITPQQIGGYRDEPRYAELTDADMIGTTSKGVTFEMPPMLALQRKHQIAREALIRSTYAVPADVYCVHCEDTGKYIARANPDHQNELAGQLCCCDAGDRTGTLDKRTAKWRGMVPKRMADYTLESCPSDKIVISIYDWFATDPLVSGRNLLLMGNVGRGKTGASIGALRHFHEAGHSVAYFNAQELLDNIKQTFDDKHTPPHNKPQSKAEKVALLLLDDLGAERVTEWGVTVIDQLLRARYDEMKPTIITSNLSKGDFANHVSERIVSRLYDSSTVIVVEGPDYRREPIGIGRAA